MRNIPTAVQAKLDSGASTFCACWRVARKDGAIMGFTDHDRDLAFADTIFRADSGLSATQVESAVGLASATSEVLGALQADSLSENDLLNGLYDGASIETWLVDWSAVDDRVLLDVATIGEVKRSEFAFSAELRSLAHLLDQPSGQSFQRACSADLGDERCTFNLATSGFTASGAVLTSVTEAIVANLGAAFESGFFTGGRLAFTSGANAGARVTVKSHARSGASHRFAFWAPPAGAVNPGDSFNVTAGCDKQASTCRVKFANLVNFRGFPHMPGNDRVFAYPGPLAERMDGGSLFNGQ